MRLLSIELRNYRGVEHRVVEFARDGVTIVEGPNEIGKSSIAEAIDRLFEDLDSTSRSRVQKIKPVGRDVGPEVAIEAETGPYRFRYRKRFLRDRTTELDVLQPRPEHHTGREAHERVLAILADTVDLPLWKALRIQQGGMIDQAALLEQRSLSAALDRAAGETPAGEEEMSVFGLVHKEYLEYWTETGRRKQEAVELDRTIDQAEDAIKGIDDALAALERDIDAVARLDVDLQRLTDRQNGQRETAGARGRQVAALAELEGGAERIEAQFDVARVLADQVRRAKTVRDEAIASVLDAVATAKQGELGLSGFAPAIEAARVRLAESEERLSNARTNRDKAKGRAIKHHADLSRFRQDQEVAQLQRRLDRVTSATTLIQDSLAAAAMPVDQDSLDSLRAQHRTVEIV